MGRSSRILCFICLFAATPVFGQGRQALVRMPTSFAPRVAVRIAHPMIRLNVMNSANLLSRPNLLSRTRVLSQPQRMIVRAGRFGTGARQGAFAFDGVGLGLGMVSDLAALPSPASGESPAPGPALVSGLAPPPCPRPLIIKIGLGLRHVARTRVIYGTPATCIP